MNINSACLSALFLLLYMQTVSLQGSVPGIRRCEFYNSSLNCEEEECKEIEECPQPSPDKRVHCYALWENNSNGKPVVKFKGCFTDLPECYDQQECISRKYSSKQLSFCCCEADMCNANFTLIHLPDTPELVEEEVLPESNLMTILLFCLVPGAVFMVVIIFYYLYRKRKLSYFQEIPTMDSRYLPPPSPLLAPRPIQLKEIKARGRFGAVWKAQYKTETVAVKIFPKEDMASWLAEYEIFKLPHMDHSNILQYIGVEKRGENSHIEYWLITAYHERGSLCDFLKCNIVSWPELCRISETMARGLMHLHEELPSNKRSLHKPAIAHRDFKSKNVLLKSDLSACIADFGLALVFTPGESCGDTHGQVGTRRYMAPEVLEGAINFSRDSFLHIDMYACGLVLWELASRCTAQEGPIPEYMLPFEEEVGQHPTLEDMQEVVVQKKIRPCIKDTWRKHVGMQSLCDTIEECWDHDAEARLSASCVMERIAYQSRLLSTAIM